MTKFFISLLFFFIPVTFLCAQGNFQAVDIMNKTNRAVAALDSYRAEVRYTDAQFSGQVHICALGKKYRVDINGMTRLYDGKNFYNIMPEEKEVTVESSSEGNISIGAMSDILNIFARNFTPAKAVKKENVWYLTLVPKKADKELQSVLMKINATTFLPKSIVEKRNTGSGATIEVISIKKDTTLTDAYFVFDTDKYKKQGYYIAKP
ncbi:MAG: hypothetical protein PHD21_07515 [Flavobacteriales bacterium]|nr:hypothetical protein [Flavobacteriales bacterium]